MNCKRVLNHILVRQIIPSDEEQTPILEDMKDMQITSLNLKRKATIRLEYLTSLVGEKRPGETTPGCMAPAIRDSESSLELQSILLEPQSKSIVISSRSLATPETRDIASHNVIGFMPSIDVNVVGSIIHNTSTPTTAPLDHILQTNRLRLRKMNQQPPRLCRRSKIRPYPRTNLNSNYPICYPLHLSSTRVSKNCPLKKSSSA
jgi:hypothetical protein